MDTADHIAALRHDGELLASAAEGAGLDAMVPTCPDWRVRDLLRHLGGVHRWAASYVTTGLERPATNEEVAGFFAAPDDASLLAWFGAGCAALADALDAADPAMTCWTFLPNARSPLAFWARRQAHETAMHRVDAESAVRPGLGAVSSLPAEFAVDGVDELLNGFFARRRGRLVADPPVSLGLRATDTGDSWSMRIEPDRRSVIAGSYEGDCVVAGPASDLYLLLWNRRDTDGLDVRGEAAVLDLWRGRATIVWG